MKRDMILKIAASTMVFSATLTGCGPVGGSVDSASSKPASAKGAAKYAAKAEKALAKGQVDDAILFAERSVAGVGTNPETRALLGQAYLAAGRFSSAERSFEDAVELGQQDAQTILSLSLAQLAQGKADKARRIVENNRQFIPAADYGLALALAGDSKAAVAVLEQAIRDSNVTGRTRQNLGLAYALDGRWKEAKLMAMQDITPSSVDQRIMQWAQMARPGAYEVRVASLLNITPDHNDPGQPVRLALNVADPVAIAATPAEDYTAAVAAFDSLEPIPVAGPAPLTQEKDVKVTTVSVPASKPVLVMPMAPLIKASAESVRVAPKATAPKKKPAAVRTASLGKFAYTPKPRASKASGHLVQLGAFSSEAGAQRAWGILSAKNADLKSFDYASSTVTVKGKTLYRLSAAGLGSAEAAKALCDGIKVKGGNCIVRKAKSASAIRLASR